MRHLALISLFLFATLATGARAESELDLPMDLEKEQQRMDNAERGGADRQAATEEPASGRPEVPAGAEAAPAQGDGTEGPDTSGYAGPGDAGRGRPFEASNAPGRGRGSATFSDDEDFLRSQENLIGDSNAEDSPHNFHVALVAQVGDRSQSGFGADFQVTVDRHWSLGVLLLTDNFTLANGDTLSGNVETTNASLQNQLYGVSANYYSRRPYEGIWIQFSLAVESLGSSGGLSDAGSKIALPLSFSVGWRFLSDSRNLTFGLALGPRLYLIQSNPTWVPLMLTVDVFGVAWNIFPH